MGEYNDTIRENMNRVEKLILLARVYMAGAQNMVLCVKEDMIRLEGCPNIAMFSKDTIHEEFITKKFQEYEAQLKKLRITGKGDIYYAEELHTEKYAIACIIKMHIEILNHMIECIFGNQEDILQEHKKYVTFLQDFVECRKKHKN